MFGEYSHLLTKPKPKGVGGRQGFREEEFDFIAVFVKILLIVAIATGVGYLSDLGLFGAQSQRETLIAAGLLAGLFYSVPQALRFFCRTGAASVRTIGVGQAFAMWNAAFVCVALVWALTSVLSPLSAAALAFFYGAGALVVLFAEAIDLALRMLARSAGRLASARVLVLGASGDIAQFLARMNTDVNGVDVAVTVDVSQLLERLRTGRFVDLAEDEQIVDAIEAARSYGVSDIVVLTSWKDAAIGAQVAECFMEIPVSVHLNGLDIADRYQQLGVARFGSTNALTLRSGPLSTGQAYAKRAFDIAVAGVALILLSPILLGIAALIWYTTDGPVLFRQRRRGLNHREFRIFKFRTMTTADDGDKVAQATRNDPRVTPIGRILRKYNLDELPQLFNVLLGDMSIVGPRPHAVAHDFHFERIVPKYRRRLNVRPGITGWAQVNGHRGETKTQADMRERVEHDLYYIENWSLALDIYILIMTVISRRAYKNAF